MPARRIAAQSSVCNPMVLNERIGAGTQRFALLGEKLGHTWSPVIHNTVFELSGTDAVYLPLPFPRESLASAADLLRGSFSGCNVTIPYKELIRPYLDSVDDAAAAIGAVNTIHNDKGKLKGYNTDGLGMIRALEEAGVSVNGLQTLILGCGGAARAASYEILAHGGSVTFAARHPEGAAKIRDSFRGFFADAENRMKITGFDAIDGDYDLLVNCTPVGMYPNTGASPVTPEVVAHCGTVFDAVYNPRTTRLLAMAGEQNKTTVEGLGMLFYQGVAAERIWFGRDLLESSVLKKIYLKILEKY